MSNFKMNMLVIDYETTGIDVRLNKHQPITCGAILIDPYTLDIIDEVYTECAFDYQRFEWDKGAEKAHGLTIEYLKDKPTIEQATVNLWEMLVNNGITPNDYITLVGHNPNFDRKCFELCNSVIGIKSKLTHRMVDTFSLGYGFASGFNSDEIFAKVGVVRDKHNALEDARSALEVLRLVRKIGNEYFTNHAQVIS